MPDLFYQLLFLVIAYLIGSIPFGFLFGKAKGIDIRKHGSNNIGATNTARVLGKKYFFIVIFLDLLKGFIFVFLFRFNILPYNWCLLSPIVYGMAAAAGHVFPIFLKFKGGKAVATGLGVVVGYSPMISITGLLAFIIVYAIKKFVSLGSLFGASTIFIASLLASIFKDELLLNLFSTPTTERWPLNLWFVAGVLSIVILIFIKHKTNIKRLVNNSESKFELKEKR